MLRCLHSDPKFPELMDLEPYAKVYEMKYEGLAADAKKCLLYCALFPLHHKINTDYLVECWIAEGFIVEKEDQKVRVNRERGLVILDKLTDDDLLLWRSGKKCVVMQPIFRRVAVVLDYPGGEKCAKWVPSKDRKPDEAVWATVRRMSLIGCKMELPKTPVCPNIFTLLLQSLKQEAERLPESFFAHMESLKVLDLSQMGITTLTGSIGKLVNLKSLYLNGCLGIVALPPEAARLERLEFLDISGTSISVLPEEIRHMVNMRCLRASLSAKGGKKVEVIIPPGIISNLRNLEELSIVTDFDFQGENGIAVAEKLAVELASLEHLNTLCFNFPNVSSLETFVTLSKALINRRTFWETQTFRSFEIIVGRHEPPQRSQEPEFSGMLAERWLRYSTNEEISQSCHELLKQVSALEIIGHDGLKSFTGSQFNLDQVKVCVVERCNRLENIVDITSENQESLLLPNLEKLYLYDLEMLKCIWNGPLPRKSLVNLTTITVDGCPKLTRILDHGLARSLEKLEYLKVENCDQISKIIEGPSGEITQVVELLKCLKKIEVSNLPELECICENPSSIRWKSLKSIIVKRCSKLRDLSLAHTNDRKLPLIHCEESWWNTLTSDDQLRCKVSFIEKESIEAGTQSRREEASTSASGSSKAITAAFNKNIDDEVLSDDLTEESEDEMMYDRPTPAIIRKPESSSEKPSRRLEEIYKVEESHLEGKKMEHEHPGTDQPFSTLSGDDVRQDQYGRTSAAASSIEVELQKEYLSFIQKEAKQIEGRVGVQHQLHTKSTPSDSSISSSIPQQISMVGADDVKYQLMDKLTSGYRDLQIIPIVGMGGSGKTTLARSIYEEHFIRKHFLWCAWVTISQKYVIREIFAVVLRQFNIGVDDYMSEHELGDKLYKHLYGRRYLIIMDDMWSIDAWDRLWRYFPNNENGSRIVVTTRLSDLASKLPNSDIIEMKLLDEADSWELLSKTVFGEEGCPLELEEVGKKIGKICKGLPLSIVAVGGLLAKSKHERECWEEIEENLNLLSAKMWPLGSQMKWNHCSVEKRDA